MNLTTFFRFTPPSLPQRLDANPHDLVADAVMALAMHSPLLLPPDVLQQALDSPRGKAEIPAILAQRARASSAAFTAEKAGLRNRNELTGAPASAQAPPAPGDVFAHLPSHPGRSPLVFGCSGGDPNETVAM